MVWPSWLAGSLPLEAAGFPVAPWAHLVPPFPALARKLRVALPCIGLDGIGNGLKEIRWDGIHISHAFDIDTELIPALIAVHGRDVAAKFCIGPVAGDLLRLDISTLADVDMIISGPPCPPWSSIGLLGGQQDKRSHIFTKVSDVIINQARRGVLICFIVEMVPGIAHDTSRRGASSTGLGDGSMKFYEHWLQELHHEMPSFRVCSWLMQTSEYLPQNRQRLYTVGLRRDVLGNTLLIPPSLPSTAQMQRATLADILHRGLPAIREVDLSPQQRANLRIQQSTLLANRPRGPACFCIAIDRDPTLNFESGARSDGSVFTLRTRNEMICLFMVDTAGNTVQSRCLHPVERLSLQGFRPELGTFLSKVATLRFTGNACTVPVITSVLRQAILPLANPSILGVPNVPRPLSFWVSSEWGERYLRTVRWLNIERGQIAVLEQIVLLQRLQLQVVQ